MGELDDVSLVTRCGKQFLHFTNDADDDAGAPSDTLFVQHFNEETCEEIKVGKEWQGARRPSKCRSKL